jgi:hypothetical protein
MPTGSLCAERNVIGSALAADLTLRRQDIRIVAVLSLSLEPLSAEKSDDESVSGAVPVPVPLPLSPSSSASSSPLHHHRHVFEVAEGESSSVSCFHPAPLSAQSSADGCVSPPDTPTKPRLGKKSLSQSSVGSPGRKRTVKLFDSSKSPRDFSKEASARTPSSSTANTKQV